MNANEELEFTKDELNRTQPADDIEDLNSKVDFDFEEYIRSDEQFLGIHPMYKKVLNKALILTQLNNHFPFET